MQSNGVTTRAASKLTRSVQKREERESGSEVTSAAKTGLKVANIADEMVERGEGRLLEHVLERVEELISAAVTEIKAEMKTTNAEIGEIRREVSGLRETVDGMDAKLDEGWDGCLT